MQEPSAGLPRHKVCTISTPTDQPPSVGHHLHPEIANHFLLHPQPKPTDRCSASTCKGVLRNNLEQCWTRLKSCCHSIYTATSNIDISINKSYYSKNSNNSFWPCFEGLETIQQRFWFSIFSISHH